MPHIKVRNVSTDNDWVIMRENDTTLRLLAEGGADIMFDGVVGGFSQGRTTTDSNTRFGIVATELMKATEDTCVRHRLAAWSPGGRLGYDRRLVHQDILVGSVQGGEDLELRLG
ncbi:unnamed protein product [Prunus brigantina]